MDRARSCLGTASDQDEKKNWQSQKNATGAMHGKNLKKSTSEGVLDEIRPG
jgi:hypothetical protein